MSKPSGCHQAEWPAKAPVITFRDHQILLIHLLTLGLIKSQPAPIWMNVHVYYIIYKYKDFSNMVIHRCFKPQKKGTFIDQPSTYSS